MSTIQTALIAAALVVSSYLLAGRYEVAAYDGMVVILDTLTGEARTCQHIIGCYKLEDND